MMKTTVLIFLSGAFFAVVLTQNGEITDTGSRLCPVNEIPVTCKPCPSFCNEEPMSCIEICIEGSFCTCANDYSRISKNNSKCVPKKLCSQYAEPNCTTNNPTIKPPKKVY